MSHPLLTRKLPSSSPREGEDPEAHGQDNVRMARVLLLGSVLASMVFGFAAMPAAGAPARVSHGAVAQRRAARVVTGAGTTNPVALAVHLAERYWGGTPACGAPQILTSSHQLADSQYETTTGPEPSGSVVEMWTFVPACTITINTSIWGNWRQDDESFQWFCDSMTHEMGHLFGHPDGGQTDRASVTYPFLDGTSPNFNSVSECRNVTLRYGSEEIRNEEILPRAR